MEFISQPPPPMRGALLDPKEVTLARKLRSNPGQFALLGDFRSEAETEAVRRRVTRGRGAWRPTAAGGAYRMSARKVGDGVWRVFVCWEADDMVDES
jgi:hypothetical protein